jgi:hypothetical protein
MRPRILAIDPGKTTGWAFAEVMPFTDDVEFQSAECNFIDMCQFIQLTTVGNHHHHADPLDLHIVSEAFLITINTAKNTQAPWSLEMMGVARYFARVYCDDDLHVVHQSAAKRFASNERLKAMDWYKPGKGHANDAARILMTFMVSRGWWDDRLGKKST